MAPKSKKLRQSRMHAAIDAMRPFGFSSKTVQTKVRALLKEYGGDDCWPFIESDAYSLLIASILEEQEEENKGEKSFVGENLLETNVDGGSDAGPSEFVLSPVGSEIVDTASHTMQTVCNVKIEPSQANVPNTIPITSQLPKTLPIIHMSCNQQANSGLSSICNVKIEPSQANVNTIPITSQPPKTPSFAALKTIQPKSENLNGWLIEEDDDDASEPVNLAQAIKSSAIKRKHSEP